METLCIIPARGGSKGIPRKNLADLGGLPLLAYSIRTALSCPSIDRVFVSTEDPEIASIAQLHGAQAHFLRPAELAQDNSITGEAVEFTLRELKRREGYVPDNIVELYPTHPFRKASMVESLTRALAERYASVRTARQVQVRPYHYFLPGEGALAAPVRNGHILPQDYATGYHRPYGSYSGRKASYASGQGAYLHILENPVELIDIDTMEDLLLARHIVDNHLFDFES